MRHHFSGMMQLAWTTPKLKGLNLRSSYSPATPLSGVVQWGVEGNRAAA